jgi:hypothetical protein
MGNVLAFLGGKIVDLAIWFYGFWDGFLWRVVKYVGIPLYIFGIVLAVAFSGGYFVLLIGGSYLYYTYIKKMFEVSPIEKPAQNNE